MRGNAGAFVGEEGGGAGTLLSLLEEEADTPRFVAEDVAEESAAGNGTCFGVCAMSVACVCRRCRFRTGGGNVGIRGRRGR
jgi:hypothetical protein